MNDPMNELLRRTMTTAPDPPDDDLPPAAMNDLLRDVAGREVSALSTRPAAQPEPPAEDAAPLALPGGGAGPYVSRHSARDVANHALRHAGRLRDGGGTGDPDLDDDARSFLAR